MPAKKTEIAKRETVELTQRPDYIPAAKGGEIAGLEDFDSQDFLMPRILVAQKMSDQVDKHKGSYIAGLEEGQFFNNLTSEVYGEEMVVVPLWAFKSRILFEPDGRTMECSSPNAIDGGKIAPLCAECPHSVFGEDGKPPRCKLLFNYIVLNPETKEVAALSFKSTSLTAGKKWNSLVRMRNSEFMFAGTYRLSTVRKENDMGAFYVIDVGNQGWTEKDLFLFCNELFENLREKHQQVVDAIHDQESTATNTEGADVEY